MNAQLRGRMNEFRKKWSDAALLRNPITPKSTDEERKAAAEAQSKANHEMHSDFLVRFCGDEVDEIRTYLDRELHPEIVRANPQPLEPERPVHEVDAEVMNEYYFFRQFL